MTRILDIDEESAVAALDLRAVVERVRGLLYVAVSDSSAADGASREISKLLFDHQILNYVALPVSVPVASQGKQGRQRKSKFQNFVVPQEQPKFLNAEELRALAEGGFGTVAPTVPAVPYVAIPVPPPAPTTLPPELIAAFQAQAVPTWKRLSASKFDTNCQKCVVRIAAGQSCWWLRGYGCHCLNCGPGENP